ncbi:long-chain fatty acid--CoA ligase [Achromobacter sp. F4_2707]|uniref:LuxE/PaaK family acyltransferase n=1 Tax=Achromobacter sp. F4_2707 TaxID=3114286 RepID=UPI0039C644E4
MTQALDATPAIAPDLLADLMDFMRRPDDGDDVFNSLALRLFTHQFQHSPAFQRYCRQQRKTPRTVKHWRDIPAVPINALKELTLSCVPPEQCERVFMTSGTTRADNRGRHYHPHLRVYDLSMKLYFAQRFMRGTPRMRMGILFPTEAMLPNSSLAHYLALALKEFGTEDSEYFISPDGLDIDRLCHVLEQAQHTQQPYALLGASYSFVHLMDALRERGQSFKLPKGSRLFDTGGFKGQSRELSLEDFYSQMTACFGVAAEACTNMYGMTELSTQFYDDGNATQPAVKSGPHWIRSRTVDPLTGQDVPAGERGVLVHCDLANFNSTTTILTEDIGVLVDGGFLLLGRAEGAQAKGCSLAMDAFLRAARE